MYDRLTLDIRDGFKRLAGTPGFTVAALTILALGIGVNAAIFSAVDALAFDPCLSHGPMSWSTSIRIPTMGGHRRMRIRRTSMSLR